MTDGLVATGMVLAVLLGVGGAAFFVMKSPAFWANVVRDLASTLWPQILAVITKPETEEVRKARQQCERSGGVWDHARKRCKNR